MLKPLPLDPRGLKDLAHTLILKGKLEAAANVYLQLIALDNKDPALRFHHAELCERLFRIDRAVASYQIAAHLHASAGHTARARAAISAGLRIAPEDSGLRRALRELSPPPRLTLVPRHVPCIPIDLVPADEAVTEPHQILDEELWNEVLLSNSGVAKIEKRTVSQRAPSRPARPGPLMARTLTR